MCALSRREFLGAATTSAAAIGFLGANPLELSADPLGLPIGCQIWPVRASIAKDFPGTIKQLADAGFQSIELCSPYGYEEFGFGGLRKYSPAGLHPADEVPKSAAHKIISKNLIRMIGRASLQVSHFARAQG